MIADAPVTPDDWRQLYQALAVYVAYPDDGWLCVDDLDWLEWHACRPVPDGHYWRSASTTHDLARLQAHICEHWPASCVAIADLQA